MMHVLPSLSRYGFSVNDYLIPDESISETILLLSGFLIIGNDWGHRSPGVGIWCSVILRKCIVLMELTRRRAIDRLKCNLPCFTWKRRHMYRVGKKSVIIGDTTKWMIRFATAKLCLYNNLEFVQNFWNHPWSVLKKVNTMGQCDHNPYSKQKKH